MASYDITGPNGEAFTLDGPDDATPEQLRGAAQRYLETLKPVTPPVQKGPQRAGAEEGDFLRGMGNIPGGIQNIFGAAKAVTGVGAKKLGFEETGTSLIKSGLESMEAGESKQRVKESDEFTNAWEKGIGTVITDWLPYQMGAGLGNLIETLGAMGIGAAAGAGVGSLPTAVAAGLGKTLLKTTVKETAEKILKESGEAKAQEYITREAKKALISMGATSGMVGQAGLHGVGEVGGRAIGEAQERGGSAEDINLAKVLPMAGVHAIADFISNKILFNAAKPIDKKVLDSLTLEIGKRVFITGAKESVPETAQAVAERFGAELSLTDKDAIKEYINTIAASFGMSVIPGGVGAVRSKLAASVPESKTKAQEEALIKAGEQPAGETTTEAGTTTEVAPFTPVLLDNIIFNSQADLDAYNKDPVAFKKAVETTQVDVEALTAEIAEMEADNADRAEKLKNKEGDEGTQKGRKIKYDNIQKEIEAKKAELAAATSATTTTVEDEKDGTDQVPDATGQEQAPAGDQKQQETPIVEPVDLTKYTNVPYLDPDTDESITLNFNEAYVEDGAILIPGSGENSYYLDYFNLSKLGPEQAALEKALLDKFAEELKAQAPADVTPKSTEVVKETPPAREYTAAEQAAVDLVKAVDAGGVPTDTRKINKIARDLGLEVSKKAKPEDTLVRIKEAVERIDTTQTEAVPETSTEQKTPPAQQQAPLPTAREATPEEQKVIDHVNLADNEGRVFTAAQSRKVGALVGIEIPKNTKEKPVTPQDAMQILRNYVGNLQGVLAGRIRQVAPNVFEGTDTAAATTKKEERVTPREKDDSEDIEKAAIQKGLQQNIDEEKELDQALQDTKKQKLSSVSTPKTKKVEQAAIDYIAAVDKGETVTLEQAVKVAKGLGVEIPASKNDKPFTLEDVNYILRNYVNNFNSLVNEDFLSEYDLAREDLAKQEEPIEIPEWDNLEPNEKSYFLNQLPAKASAVDFTTALEELADYRSGRGRGAGYKKKKVTAKEQQIIDDYEDQRPSLYKQFGANFPAWNDLTPEAQQAYKDIVTSNAPIQEYAAFKAVQDTLKSQGISIFAKGRQQEKENEASSLVKAQARMEQEQREAEEAVGRGKMLSEKNGTKDVLDAILRGDINGALKLLAKKANGLKLMPERLELVNSRPIKVYSQFAEEYSAKLFRSLALALDNINFGPTKNNPWSSRVITDADNETIKRLVKEKKLAEYDPKTDTFYFALQGVNPSIDEATFFHEVVHAATVRVIYKFLTNPSSLDPAQREAMEHLQKVFDSAKSKLGGKFRNAFENLYEFVGYALTDSRFQNALSEIQSRDLSKYTSLASLRNLWGNFTLALAKLYRIVKPNARKQLVDNELAGNIIKNFRVKPDSQELFEVYSEEVMEGKTDIDSYKKWLAERKSDDETETTPTFRSANLIGDIVPGYKGNLLLETTEIFSRILEKPEAGIDIAPLAASASGAAGKKTQQTKKAPTPLRTGAIGIGEKDQVSNEEYLSTEEVVGRDKGFWRKLFTTQKGWENIARVFQNDRYPIKSWERKLALAEALVEDLSKKFNNIYTQIVLSSGRAKDLYERHVAGPAQALDMAINNFAKATGLDLKAALAQLHMIVEAIHEKERREAKYIMLVPLDSTSKVVNSKGKLISPAARRQEILGEHDNNKRGELDDPNLTLAQARQLRTELNFLTDKKNGYVVETGYSPAGLKIAKDEGGRLNTDINNRAYNVVGVDPDTAQARRDEIASKDNKFKAEIDEVTDALKGLHDATKMLDIQSNYWSKPVSNRVAFYGFKNYIPLKGKKGEKTTTIDEMLDFTSARMGSEVDKPQGAFGGRESIATDPLLQSMSDATRSALRAGRKNITQSIINAIDQGWLSGIATYDKKPIPFEQRFNIKSDENTIFHYAENGEITIIKFIGKDKSILNSIRRTYKAVNPLVDIANDITSLIGQFHTRYNYAFGPMNFVRDILTNAFTMGVDLGPTKSLAFIADVSAKVANGGLFKAMQFIAMYNRGDFTSISNLAKNDPFVQDMLDFYTEGGMVTYIDGIAIKSNFAALQKEIGRNGVLKTKEQVDKFVDIWTNMFELASRAAAYGVAKRSFTKPNMTKSELDAVKTKAAAYAKNLANFEQVGQIGKTMGAFYMFFRPAATGAVRAIEAVVPAFRSVESALKSMPQSVQLGITPEAKTQREAFIKNYKQQQHNARIMTSALFGVGVMAYWMSSMMSPDDELGRNKVKSDNMQQWSRYARFHLPDGLGLGKDVVFQIPWGFGLGAFAAAGAQMSAVAFGKSTIADAAANIALQISLDSFVPIPVSKMNPIEDPLNFALDSIAPSTVRPILEFALNKNGLGQNIYNDSNRRIGDAYVGGDNIPQIYKDLSRTIAQQTNGLIDWSPNSIYFLANSYVDGLSRIFETGYGLTDLAQGRKEFNAKTDLPLANSFFGTRSNVDSREFSSVEKQILAKEQRINMFKGDPVATMKYQMEFPMDEMIVKQFNTMVNGELKRLRTEAKNFRLMEGISPKERESVVKMITLQQNLIKHNIIETFKAYNIKP